LPASNEVLCFVENEEVCVYYLFGFVSTPVLLCNGLWPSSLRPFTIPSIVWGAGLEMLLKSIEKPKEIEKEKIESTFLLDLFLHALILLHLGSFCSSLPSQGRRLFKNHFYCISMHTQAHTLLCA
jgi:hypothetical protein